MKALTLIKESLLHLFFPHLCAGCGSSTLDTNNQICATCIHTLPFTHFETQSPNPIETILSGRLKFENASAHLYFTKHSILQQIIHQFKYKNNKDLGLYLGMMMGKQIIKSQRFNNIEALIPLPLHKSKLKKRGYNQAQLLCDGISKITQIPIINNVVIRSETTETQTQKNRTERWKNMESKFALINQNPIQNKHVLLVDDVITTGATIEACGQVLLQVSGLKLSVATLCYTSNI